MKKIDTLDQLLQKEELKDLDPEMLAQTAQIMKQLKGKSDQEVLESLMKLAAQNKKSNKQLTPKQRNAILQVMRELLPSQQQKKFDAVIKMMNMMNM